ncbi:5'-methylthioadenosine/S-adenosylhomocysteine nucleosidase [Phenylobacterium sp.]|jgi:adenosylhomocysteine nucleosidase|uniref:5'-methylthioadenosine/S-adenosylhomocysteine nucleosidase n=1 Tax=Phenylobacterium sp. TaxID=1871053 RepID=UPI002E325298|nr:5'-methylthioadenosine/S-adenosylhomocysteine nucleosidase [Phenylobacterium sp.]HEX3367296.1 5'-methylthioadenosine/S-adenosylhomocysteine nucleosidase [Phenylobacterium sp.]
MRLRLTLLALCAVLAGSARAADDTTPRIAVISAFAPELVALEKAATHKHTVTLAGTVFTTGVLEGKPVVLFLSGMSMVNAAMTTQRAIDRFHVSRIVFSGIAGGVDPGLDVGDVVTPDQWGQYLESVMAREDAPGHYAPPAGEPLTGAPFGMMYPKAVEVLRAPTAAERRAWFPADPALIAVARRVAGGVALKRCTAAGLCLKTAPHVVVGGNGVSGQAFVDNAALRAWAYSTFHAEVLDMESAAVAQVALVNGTPFIAFRSLSDLAGGDPGANQAGTFFQLASDNSAAVVRAFVAALPR